MFARKEENLLDSLRLRGKHTFRMPHTRESVHSMMLLSKQNKNRKYPLAASLQAIVITHIKHICLLFFRCCLESH